ncbi:transposase family protein [Amycolatopsis sp. A1MSW2902]|uniref:transposase family protein n=1 Tax=Amycolatopsis sp. A1MSW2902 TaxID=687413 RepID=UPI003FCE42B8
MPGSRNNLSAARDHGITGTLTAAAAQGLKTPADKAYHSAGTGILTPVKNTTGRPPLTLDEHTRNLLHTRLRCLGERAAAILKTRSRAFRHITNTTDATEKTPSGRLF